MKSSTGKKKSLPKYDNGPSLYGYGFFSQQSVSTNQATEPTTPSSSSSSSSAIATAAAAVAAASSPHTAVRMDVPLACNSITITSNNNNIDSVTDPSLTSPPRISSTVPASAPKNSLDCPRDGILRESIIINHYFQQKDGLKPKSPNFANLRAPPPTPSAPEPLEKRD
jgi:hypothetical protein